MNNYKRIHAEWKIEEFATLFFKKCRKSGDYRGYQTVSKSVNDWLNVSVKIATLSDAKIVAAFILFTMDSSKADFEEFKIDWQVAVGGFKMSEPQKTLWKSRFQKFEPASSNSCISLCAVDNISSMKDQQIIIKFDGDIKSVGNCRYSNAREHEIKDLERKIKEERQKIVRLEAMALEKENFGSLTRNDLIKLRDTCSNQYNIFLEKIMEQFKNSEILNELQASEMIIKLGELTKKYWSGLDNNIWESQILESLNKERKRLREKLNRRCQISSPIIYHDNIDDNCKEVHEGEYMYEDKFKNWHYLSHLGDSEIILCECDKFFKILMNPFKKVFLCKKNTPIIPFLNFK